MNYDLKPDLRYQVPDLIPYLFKGEKVIYVMPSLPRSGRPKPSTLHEIYSLTHAHNYDEVGAMGPIYAATTFEPDEDRPELHLYETIYGRDSLRVSLNLLKRYPKLARDTLIRLARLQGRVVHPAREEEPGRIIHETRDPKHDPIARQLTKEKGWGWPYYGAVDSTLEFIRTFCAYCNTQPSIKDFLEARYIARDGVELTMAESLITAINWAITRLDSNAEGLLEYKSMIPKGLENQVWKDSWDAYSHADGTLASHKFGIASIEVQRVAYDALIDAAELFETRLDRVAEAAELRVRAENLQTAIMTTFWTDERGGYFVLGTDRDDNGKIRPLKVKTSNMGHLLHSRLLSGDDPDIIHKREAVIRQLFSSELLNTGGIRTLATSEKRFRPGSYHNGSVWLWDTYLIAQGLEAAGYLRLAKDLERRIKWVVDTTRQFPEFIRGDSGDTPALNNRIVDIWDSVYNQVSRIEQPPQEVQAWSVAAIISIKMHGSSSHQTLDKDKSKFEQSVLDY